MKKMVKKIMVVGLLVFGITLVSHAVTQYCVTVTITCENGGQAKATACGTSTDEILIEAQQLAEAICDNM